MSTSLRSTDLAEELGVPTVLRMQEGVEASGGTLISTGNVLVLNDRAEILLGRRVADEEHEPGRWNLPGGVRQPEETFLQAALREAAEEFGVQLSSESLQFFRSYRCIYPDRIVDAACFLARVQGRPSLVLSEREFSEGGFFPLSEAASWSLAFRQEVILRDLLASGMVSNA
jgi:8-oxo-dGTP pyrophosphatase MutT (NUDIX family)